MTPGAAGLPPESTPVAGRGGVPADASAAILSVVGVTPDGPGFLTVWPCGEDRPTASNVNLNRAGDVVPNAVLANQFYNEINPGAHYATTGPEISSIALKVASFGDIPSSIWCSTASTTTIASRPRPARRMSPPSFTVSRER